VSEKLLSRAAMLLLGHLPMLVSKIWKLSEGLGIFWGPQIRVWGWDFMACQNFSFLFVADMVKSFRGSLLAFAGICSLRGVILSSVLGLSQEWSYTANAQV